MAANDRARPAAGMSGRRRTPATPGHDRAALPVALTIIIVLAAVVVTVLYLGARPHGVRATNSRAAGSGRPNGRPGRPASSPGAAPATTSTEASPTTSAPTTSAPTTSAAAATTSAPTTSAPPSPRGVGLARCTFVDRSRGTFDYATGKMLPGRTLRTEIRYPTAVNVPTGARRGAPPLEQAGGYPTIFFAPGYDVTPDNYARLLDAWVRNGFVVVAPTFPDTNPTAVAAAKPAYGQPENDLTNQPADLVYVIHAALGSSSGTEAGCGALRGLLDPSALALAGQSDGGDTVALLAYGQTGAGAGIGNSLPIDEIGAAAILSGSEWPTATYGAGPGAPPLLVVQSATDECNPPQRSVTLYDAIGQSDKWFLALKDADHLGPYDGDDSTAFADVVSVTTRFFRSELAGGPTSADTLTAGRALPGATVTSGANAPSLPVLPFSKPACAAPGPVKAS